MTKSVTPWFSLAGAVGLLVAVMAASPVAGAATYQVIYEITGSSVSLQPPLAAGPNGELFVVDGGSNDVPGTIYTLVPPSGGSTSWSGFPFYRFGNGASAGLTYPWGVTVTNGALLGTTENGGSYGLGVAYRLDGPPSKTFTTLHAFSARSSPAPSYEPVGGLTLGLGHFYYGVSVDGVYAIGASAAAPKFQYLNRFSPTSGPSNPTGGNLAVDANGDLLGATRQGSTMSPADGTVYGLQYANGGWTTRVLYNFGAKPKDMLSPAWSVAVDARDTIYGCASGGRYGAGGVFRLTPPARPDGSWTETTLYNFGSQPNDPFIDPGDSPCSIAVDPTTGQLFGTSSFGGAFGFGTVFELDPPAQGQTAWTEVVVHSADGSATDGGSPFGPPLLVGHTFYGIDVSGTVWMLTP